MGVIVDTYQVVRPNGQIIAFFRIPEGTWFDFVPPSWFWSDYGFAMKVRSLPKPRVYYRPLQRSDFLGRELTITTALT